MRGIVVYYIFIYHNSNFTPDVTVLLLRPTKHRQTTLPPQSAEPIKKPRLQVVDALRGVALLGILVVHCRQWFVAAAPAPLSLLELHAAGTLNTLVASKIDLLLASKFYSFFSFLFGLSFALMMARAPEAPAIFRRQFMRRLFVLGAIGFLHYLHWRGDILFIYAALVSLLLVFS